MDSVQFADPPNVPTRYDWAAIAGQLKAQPMKWALIFTRDRTSIANAARQGSIAVVKPGAGFEYRTANNTREPDRTCSLYMRYNPSKDIGEDA